MIKPITGVNYSHFFLRMDGTRAKYYYDEADLASIGFGYYKKNKTVKQLKYFIRLHKQDYLKAKRLAKKNPKHLQTLSLKELVRVAQKTTKELSMAVGTAHCIEGISFVSELKIKEMLDKRGLNNHENFQILSAAIKPSFLSQAQMMLWQIKNAKKEKQKILVKRFLKKFGWIDNSYVKAIVLSHEDVVKKSKAQKYLPTFEKLKNNKSSKARLIKELGLSEKEKFVINTVEVCTSWQDDRKKYLLETLSWLEPVVEELALRVNIPTENFKFIHSRELTYPNLTSPKFVKLLLNRYPKSDSYAIKNKIFIFTEKDSAYIEKCLNKPNNQRLMELKGMVACKGFVKGRVKICASYHDIAKVKKGEILVTSMTRPEFLPAMQKAAGFVTDEGGVTSHAGIVSREMNKPCIIGTKIATRVLKDGDMVEVDANKGIVRKI
ncbi:MAG: hypothetical protein HY918_02235 [Candidatus Doudnabacteria bacterium]|nr:hypothetical protein [Candidatus Doudnabacteria bacterium]